jgi:hypothetical protein
VIEDKLSGDQRIRLEAVAQANARLGPRLTEPPERAIGTLLQEANRIARYITGDEPATEDGPQ